MSDARRAYAACFDAAAAISLGVKTVEFGFGAVWVPRLNGSGRKANNPPSRSRYTTKLLSIAVIGDSRRYASLRGFVLDRVVLSSDIQVTLATQPPKSPAQRHRYPTLRGAKSSAAGAAFARIVINGVVAEICTKERRYSSDGIRIPTENRSNQRRSAPMPMARIRARRISPLVSGPSARPLCAALSPDIRVCMQSSLALNRLSGHFVAFMARPPPLWRADARASGDWMTGA
jgi:hypothetical protein